MNGAVAGDARREALIQDLYTWGPALTDEVRARYPNTMVLQLARAKILVRKRFTGFQVYLLSGLGLRPYGYSMRYNYVPSKNVVLGSLIARTIARQYVNDGYTVTVHEGYAKRGRDNLLLAEKNGALTVVVGRAALTMRALRIIVDSLRDHLPNMMEVHAVVLEEGRDEKGHDPVLLNTSVIYDLPFTLIQLPLARVIHEKLTQAPAQE